jgi:uncharacterized protein YkwD
VFPNLKHLLFLALVSPAVAGSVEQAVLAEINLARTQPQAYAQIVAGRAPSLGNSPKAIEETVQYLQKQKPVGALTESAGLTQAALAHLLDTGPRGIKGHQGTDGSHVDQRADRFGHWDQLVGENLVYGKGSARDWMVCLIVDEGVAKQYHRVNLFKKEFRVVGIAAGTHATAGQMMVTDFAAKYREASASVASR